MKKMNRTQRGNIQVGIDLGSSKICCVIAEVDSIACKIKLLGIGSVPSEGLSRASIVHRDRVITQLELAIHEAETMADIKVEHSWLIVSGEHIRGINTQGAIAINQQGKNSPAVSEQEIRQEDVFKVLELARAISFPIDREILHILPQEYLVDTMNRIQNPVGISGRRLEAKVHLVTVASSTATNLTNCVNELGIEVDGLVYQGIASALSTLDVDEKDLGVALVDIGSDVTDVTVYHENGIRHSGVIPLGSDTITNDIAVMLQISKADAEKIKIKYGSAKSSMASPDLEFDIPVKNGGMSRKISEHELARYIEARMVENLQYVAREISRADVQEKLTYGVVLTGGGSELANLAVLAEETLGMRARIGRPKGISGVVDIAGEPRYAASLGLLQWTLTHDDHLVRYYSDFTAKTVFKKFSKWFKEFF
jgi:cell division protein FtsA